MRLDIYWTGKSYTNQIDNLDAAYDAAYAYARENDINLTAALLAYRQCNDAEWNAIESAFAEVAFEGWHTVPDGWGLEQAAGPNF